MVETRFLSPSGLTADGARRLLGWLLAQGADEFSVAVRAIEGEPAATVDAFEDALEPFALPNASRPVPGGAGSALSSREVRRWALTPASLAALLPFLPGGLFDSPVGPSGWLEDLAVHRRGELLLGVVTHEREGVLRLTPTEHAAVESLGVASTGTGEWLGDEAPEPGSP